VTITAIIIAQEPCVFSVLQAVRAFILQARLYLLKQLYKAMDNYVD